MSTNKLDAETSTLWLVFDVTGQWCLFLLLATFALVNHLPQLKNPFLVNFILTTFLATIPPSLLLYTGTQHGKASLSLCFAQVALIDATTPMFGVAHLMLVFDTWSELCSICLHKPHITRKRLAKYLLIFAPYITMCIWACVSLVAAFHSQPKRYDGFVYCILTSPAAKQVRNAVGFFMSVVGLVGLFFELWVCWMIYAYPVKAQKNPLVWRTNIQFALRVVIYSLLLFIVVTVGLINRVFHNSYVKAVYRLLDSTNALFAFIVFGTQKDILRVWKFWDRKKSSEDLGEQGVQRQTYPTLDWANIPAEKPVQFMGTGLEHEEMG